MVLKFDTFIGRLYICIYIYKVTQIMLVWTCTKNGRKENSQNSVSGGIVNILGGGSMD
jgi:hypothetical protein